MAEARQTEIGFVGRSQREPCPKSCDRDKHPAAPSASGYQRVVTTCCDPHASESLRRMSNPEHIGTILPRVLSHLWNATTFEAGCSINRCPCGVIRRQYDGRTEYWRWEGRELRRLALPPPHADQVA